MTDNEQILWETDFQIISEEELHRMQNDTENDTENNTKKNTEDDENLIDILKQTWVYDELDEETRQKLNQI